MFNSLLIISLFSFLLLFPSWNFTFSQLPTSRILFNMASLTAEKIEINDIQPG